MGFCLISAPLCPSIPGQCCSPVFRFASKSYLQKDRYVLQTQLSSLQQSPDVSKLCSGARCTSNFKNVPCLSAQRLQRSSCLVLTYFLPTDSTILPKKGTTVSPLSRCSFSDRKTAVESRKTSDFCGNFHPGARFAWLGNLMYKHELRSRLLGSQ